MRSVLYSCVNLEIIALYMYMFTDYGPEGFLWQEQHVHNRVPPTTAHAYRKVCLLRDS